MKKLAIVGTFYDGYYSVWEDFLELLFKNWESCPYEVHIVNDEKEIKFEKKYNVTVHHAGRNAEYSQRVQTALKNIDADYYLLLLEDFFVGKKLDHNVLNDVMSFIIEHDIKYYRMPMGEFTPFYKKGIVEKISPSSEYTISCQPSIWKKEFLRQCIGDEVFNAWIFEGIYAKSPKAHTVEFLEGCYVDYRNVLNLYHGAIQGCFINKTVSHFRNVGYEFRAKLPMISLSEERKYKIKYYMICICPRFVRRLFKKFSHTNSVIDKYSDRVQELIDYYGLN